MTASYGAYGSTHRHLTDAHWAVVTATLAAGIWCHGLATPTRLALAALLGLAMLTCFDATLALIIVVAFVGGATLGQRAWTATEQASLGPYAGWATVVEDPAPSGPGTRTVLEIEGERYRASAYGSMRHRVGALEAGHRVVVAGERVELRGRYARSARARHIVGDFELDTVADTAPGTPLALASNRVRGLLRDGATRGMAQDDAALFTGLVIGDDTRQRPATIAAFRAAGLSHLTAVSGQNVSFVIAVAGVIIRPLARWWRLAVTLGLIGWFAVITRLEPSVLRAGVMAGLSATAFALGRDRGPARLLAMAVAGLLVVDPLLLWSVGFWLSSGATFGVTVVAPRIERRLGGPQWLATSISVTVGAQVGVLLPSVLVFRQFPVLGVPANLCAVPVAGAVMFYGLPAGLVAGFLPDALASALLAPATVGTRWVAVTARTFATIEPVGSMAVLAVLAQLGAVGLLVGARYRRPRVPVER